MLIFVFILFGSQAQGQDQVSYKNIWDNPYTWKSLIVNVHWFDVGMPIGLPELMVGVGADYQLNKRVLFSFDYSKEWLSHAIGADDIPSPAYLEAGGTFCFASWLRNGKVKFSWTDASMRYTVKVPCKVLKQYGVRGGVLDYNNYEIYNTKGIYTGVSIITTRNRMIDISGIRSDLTDCETRKNFYIDVMYGAVVTIGDFNVNDSSFTNRFGYRMGCMWTGASIWGLYTKSGIEFGLKPGIFNNYFLLFRFAISLGFEVPSLSNKEEKQKDGLSGE
ncbi:MAG: hypothetical protein A3H98_12375 [Bacteroidetes bacterium RIFCSPLOWO2_02_FULL_36_8]|nr:MAG: hypothetical protein A3H98_12375 [Bacteroidetes bacterium RIFCSPLOWO2_02_FULL_36_8]OFY71090.1 MAG: hypothetical protein A3G23_14870 [Bacteroidetes bacterium RIFCSPLOWO2_12_FULL_37_12]